MESTQQFPTGDQVFLDHVGIFVSEFTRSGAAMQRLGFTLTDFHAHRSALQPGAPLAPLGTGNRCAMLRIGFLEILGPTGEATPIAAALHAALARYDGLHLVAFSATEPAGFHAAAAGRGLQPAPIARIRRNHPTPDGGEVEVGGSIVRLAPEAWPEGRVQVVFPEMPPEAMWQPHLLRHANGADRLGELLLAVDDPAARADQFARFTGKPVRSTGPRRVLELDRGRVHLTTVAEVERALPGLRVPTRPYMAAVAIGCDLDQCSSFLRNAGIAHATAGGTVQVAPAEALGAVIVFHERADDRPFDALLA